MATSVGQYAPVSLPGGPPIEKSGRTQSTRPQRAGHNWGNPVLIDATFFFLFWPVAALPLRDFSMKVFQLLGLWGPWWHNVCRDLDCIRPGSYGPISLFLSLLEPANRRPVWPAFLWSSAHSCPQRAPLPGVLLCFLACQAQTRPGWGPTL